MPYSFDIQEGRLWSALKAHGMLHLARVALPECDGETLAYVDLSRPDITVVDGMGLSTEWAIEYRSDELPGLAEGNEVLIESPMFPGGRKLFKVRREPTVEEFGTGFFRLALLTEAEEC